MESPRFSAISLFTGAGGLDLGFEAAGFETAAALEMDTDCVLTLRANRAWPVIEREVSTVTTRELLDTANLASAEADILVGGPPCQPFSKSGYWARGDSARLEDPRAQTLHEYLRVLEEALPRVFLLENVAGLAYSGKSEGLEYLKSAVELVNRRSGTNYSFEVAKLNAAHYGVPQERERIFIVGGRDGRHFEFPTPTHAPASDDAQIGQEELPFGSEPEPYLTAWDAIGEFDDEKRARDHELKVGGKWADLLASIPEGENYLWHTDRGGGLPLFGWRRRYWSFLLKLSKARPSWTITADPGSAIGPFHWRSRRLDGVELCRLQTFPDGYALVGSRRSVQRQLGNAVPSALAEKLALEIRRQLLGDSTAHSTPMLLPQRRSDMPEAERTAEVPNKYLVRIGAHTPHPGTGQGYGARRQRLSELESERPGTIETA